MGNEISGYDEKTRIENNIVVKRYPNGDVYEGKYHISTPEI